MALDQKTVQSIARLAQLSIAEHDINRYCDELSNILDLVAQIDACDTSNVEPMTHPFDAIMRLRDDQITESNQREKFQSVAPSTERGLYLVPKVID